MLSDLIITLSSSPPPGWEEGLLREIWQNLIFADRYKMFTDGLILTLLITVTGIMIGVVLGFIAALMNLSKYKILRIIATTYITVIRGIPLLVQLFIWTFIIFANPAYSRLFICFVTFGVNSGAYVSEIFRAGILSIDKGQTEAGRSVGLSSFKTMRLIVFPQAIKNALPPLCNEFITLLKDTSLVSVVGVMDITMVGNVIRSRTFSAFVPLITSALIYLVIVIILTWLLGKLERRLRVSDNR